MADLADFTQRETPALASSEEKTGQPRIAPALVMALSTLLLGACELSPVQNRDSSLRPIKTKPQLSRHPCS
jgi:hypothetical protein